VHRVLRSPGQPLDQTSREFFEPRFGRDFSQVRVHADENAAKSAKAVGAMAYAVGHNLVFGAGQYASGSSARQRLLAHELTHVVQQSARGVVVSPVSIEDSPRAEYEADRTAAQVVSGEMPRFEPAHPASDWQRAAAPASAPASRNVDSMPLEEAVKKYTFAIPGRCNQSPKEVADFYPHTDQQRRGKDQGVDFSARRKLLQLADRRHD